MFAAMLGCLLVTFNCHMLPRIHRSNVLSPFYWSVLHSILTPCQPHQALLNCCTNKLVVRASYDTNHYKSLQKPLQDGHGVHKLPPVSRQDALILNTHAGQSTVLCCSRCCNATASSWGMLQPPASGLVPGLHSCHLSTAHAAAVHQVPAMHKLHMLRFLFVCSTKSAAEHLLAALPLYV